MTAINLSDLQRWLFASFVIATALVGTACERSSGKVRLSTIDSQHPFGFDWTLTSAQVEEMTEYRHSQCRAHSAMLEDVFGVDDITQLMEDCVADLQAKLFIPQDSLPTSFQEGEVSLVLVNETDPSVFEYTFFHRVLPASTQEDQKRRAEHSKLLRDALVAAYGSPTLNGAFDQYSKTGFIITDEEEKPCNLWIIEDISILLCSERIVLIDGIEMSLSFSRLDRVDFGQALRSLVIGSLGGDEATQEASLQSEFGIEFSTNNSAIEELGILEALSYWSSSDDFRDCKVGGLEPIDAVWTLSDEETDALRSILDEYSGEELALYAIEYAGDLDFEIPARKRDKILMFLLNHAATQGSVIAMNEIGASLLYCYQHVEQDQFAAQDWLKAAATGGDVYAMHSLSRMHLAGMTQVENPKEAAVRLLEQCSKLDADLCSDELAAVKAVETE